MGLKHIHTCQPTSTYAARFHERRISSVSTSAHAGGRGPSAGQFVRFWASGEQSSQKWEIPCLGRRSAVHSSTPLALSSAEISVTIQIHKQTVNDISTPCLSACVDNDCTIAINTVVHTDLLLIVSDLDNGGGNDRIVKCKQRIH